MGIKMRDQQAKYILCLIYISGSQSGRNQPQEGQRTKKQRG